MVYQHTLPTELAIKHLESVIKGNTNDNLSNVIEEITLLYNKAVEVQNLSQEFSSGSYSY